MEKYHNNEYKFEPNHTHTFQACRGGGNALTFIVVFDLQYISNVHNQTEQH